MPCAGRLRRGTGVAWIHSEPESMTDPKSGADSGQRGNAAPPSDTPEERSLHQRELAAEAREKALRVEASHVDERESAVAAREGAVLTREDAARLREEAVRAQEAAMRAKADLEQLMSQIREVNEQLVVATVRAQTMTEEAERANHLKDEFLATVSHELRTPLNAVLGWARILASGQLTERRAHAIQSIERNASMLAHIIDDLLDVSRIMSGKLHLTYEPIDLKKISEAAIDTVKTLAEEKSIQITVMSDSADAEPVSGDASRLQQVIGNLLSNAIKFTPAGGHVDISLKRSGRDMEVSIVDTGQGIEAAFLPHVFEPFRQAAGATTRRHTGIGLGLAIVRQIVELHGGTVRAESLGPGRGATFTICLPIESAAEPLDHEFAIEGIRPALQRLDGLHVLIVEDHADSLELMSTVLGHVGARVTTSSSVSEALETLRTEHPDVVVSDIGLPDEDGYALIREIRRRETDSESFLPAVALTGFTRAEDRTRVLAAGFQAHVPKPVEPAELTAVIAALTLPPRRREVSPDPAS